MKIGLVCPYSVSRGGGVQEIVYDLRKGLVKRGHDVRILTPQPRDVGDIDTTGMIFLGNGADFRSPTHTTFQVSASADTDVIDQVLEHEQFDILHFHEPWVPVLSRQVLARSKAVNIATFHGAVPETLMSRTVVRVVTPYTSSILKYLHEFTAVSEAAASYVRSLTDTPIQIIPNGIDLTRYKWNDHAPIAGKPRTILFIGRLEKRKGVNYLLQAFKVLQSKEPDIHLLIAGDGPDREKLELLTEDLQLQNVSFLGYISEAQKMQLLAEADIFCSPALYGESFGLVLLEAMATGAVTVAGSNRGYDGVMQGFGQISLVNPRDDVEFARRLSLLLNEPGLQKDWRKWAKNYVKQYAYPHIIDAYEACYEDALKKHRRR